MNFLKGESILMRRSREKWRGKAEVSSLTHKKGNEADRTQGFSHHAQVLLPNPLSSADRGREIPTHRAPPRRPLAASERERAGTWRQGWELQTERGGSCPGERPAAFRRAGLEEPLTGGVSTTAPTPPRKEKKKTTSLAHQKPLGESQEAGLLLSLS